MRFVRTGFVLSALLASLVGACGPQDGASSGDLPSRDVLLGEARAAATTGHKAFRVMTYNVRGPLDTGVLAWPNRKAAVIQRILANNADIVGVQEAQAPAGGPSIPADLIAGLTGTDKPYGVYNPGGGSPKLIFFKKSRFEMAPEVGHGNESLVNPYAPGAPCFSHAEGKKIAWVGLRDLTSGQVYFVANTHFAYAAACSLGRLKEAAQMAAFLATKPAGLPVIAMGDFNADAQSTSTPGESTLEDLEAGAKLFRTARFDGTTGEDDATFNNAWDGTPSTNYARLDYIFHNGGVLTSSAPAIDRTESGGNTPSDHFAVLATLRPALFSAGSTFSPTPGGTSPATQVFFADVTGDGCADRISWNATLGEGETWVAISRCDGSFVAAVKNEGAFSAVSTTRFSFADVTGDGCADKVLWRPTLGDGEVRIYPGTGTNFAGSPVMDNTGYSGSENTTFAFADIDGRGGADKVYWNPNSYDGDTKVFRALAQ